MKIEVYKPLTVDKCREILGKEATGLSDVEIAEIRDSLFKKMRALYSKNYKTTPL